MKHLKTYEENVKDPQIGDYVVCITKGLEEEFMPIYIKKIAKIIHNNVGQIIDFKPENSQKYNPYHVKYDLPKNFYDNTKYIGEFQDVFLFDTDKILFFSKDKEQAELYLKTKKYNI
jgi:hypothetical protein